MIINRTTLHGENVGFRSEHVRDASGNESINLFVMSNAGSMILIGTIIGGRERRIYGCPAFRSARELSDSDRAAVVAGHLPIGAINKMRKGFSNNEGYMDQMVRVAPCADRGRQSRKHGLATHR